MSLTRYEKECVEKIQNSVFPPDADYSNGPSDADIKRMKRMLSDSNGHTHIHSGKLSDTDVLQRMLDEGKPVDGQFTSEKHMYDAIANTIYYHVEDIVHRLEYLDIGENTSFSARQLESFDDQPLGSGFIKLNGFYHRFESENASIVLRRDELTPLGFHLRTAFPGIEGNAEEQSKSLTISNESCEDTMRTTDYYKKSSPVKKTQLLYASDPKNKFKSYVTYSSTDDKENIVLIKDNNDGTQYRAYIGDGKMSVAKKDKDGKPVEFDIARKCSRKNHTKISLTNNDARDAFAKEEPEFFERIKSVEEKITEAIHKHQQRMAKTDKTQKSSNVREIPAIDESTAEIKIPALV